jgi:cytoskeletal protein CcmA (bactofilin family)
MGLVVSNISGSHGNGEVLNGESLIAVTGAIAFGIDGPLNPLSPEEGVHFYVNDAAQFADAVYVDGTLAAAAIDASSLELSDGLIVSGSTVLGVGDDGDLLTVNADATFNNPVDMKDGLVVTGTLIVSDANATGGLIIEGDVEMENNVNVAGNLFVTGAVEVNGVLVKQELDVLGATTLEGIVTINDATEITAGGLVVTGGIYLDDADIADEPDTHVATKGYVDNLVATGGGFTIAGDIATTDGGTTEIAGGNTLALSGTINQIELIIPVDGDSVTFALTDDVTIPGLLTAGTGSFGNDVTVGADLEVDGSTVLGLASTDLLTVEATSTFNADVTVTGTTLAAITGSFSGDLSADGDVTLGTGVEDALTVNAVSTFEADVTINGNTFTAVSGTFGGDLTVEGNLTVNGTTTTIDSINVLIEDPFILLAKNSSGADANGGIIILNGASDGEDLALGRVAGDTWGVVKLDSANGTSSTIVSEELVKFRAAELQVGGTSDYIALSGSNNDLHIHATSDLLLCVGAAKDLIMMEDGAAWLTFDMNTNNILPAVDNSISLGSLTNRFKNVFTGDLHLQNDRGHWTLIEEENFITFRDNKTGRRFKMVMEDITGTGTYGPGNDGQL